MTKLKRLVKRMLWSTRGFASDGSEIVWRPRRLINTRGRVAVGRNLFVGRDSVFNLITSYGDNAYSPSVRIGDDVYIGHHFSLHCASNIAIGSGVVFSDHVYISDNAHGLAPDAGDIMKQPLEAAGDVEIGDNCFVGYGSSILPGVSLGPWCVVGTRSVVTKSFPGYVMVAGAPARPIKRWCDETRTWISTV